MKSITQNKRYCPHEITTKLNSVNLYRLTKDLSFVCRRYHISKASLMRWNKRYDGTKELLLPRSYAGILRIDAAPLKDVVCRKSSTGNKKLFSF